MKSIDSFRTLVRLQLILLPCDLILGLFALARRHIFFTVAAAYAIQILVVAANFVLLFLGFTATIPFRAGASNALFRDFAVPLGMGVVYLLALLAFRGYGAVGSSPCDNDRWVKSPLHLRTLDLVVDVSTQPPL
ncbi:hypothetical protein M427DRAFT_30030 [Gonapodya prolifera JEL478]|uniref:Uncharacterized protein n=1 Tax=Gonapodya prolifera (strain JEL478) TaxID=1344416 RepID=A0A139AMA5_GONPJ|nr:hypothetical protein M427DRAFT_30030 [Gonapodya prolifera JEL478]|eukprot:KXS17900.1 hypothetical protein M427DRAFT_30030 [Gonapodya prolifera JEL478]